MLRLNPTGNSVFDAVEVAAWALFDQQINRSDIPITENQIKQAEIQYLYSCWKTAITQYDGQPGGGINGSGSTGIIKLSNPNVVVPLQNLAQNLATQLKYRNWKLPSIFYLAAVATIVNGGAATYVVGDVMTTSGGVLWDKGTSATWTVLTLSSGTIATMGIKYPGFYQTVPTGNVALTGGSGGGSPTATIVWYPFPVLYNS